MNQVISRTIAAILGGYLLANMAGIVLAYLLPGSRENAVLFGTQLSFLIYALVVIWVFAVRSEKTVWVGMAVSLAALLATILLLLPEGVL